MLEAPAALPPALFGPRFGANWDEAYAKAPMSDPELGKLVCDNWASYIEWIDGMGLVTEELAPGSPYVWMGGKRPAEEGSKSYTDEYLQQFGEIFTQKGGTTLLGTRATKLLTDESGAVVGLIAEDTEGLSLLPPNLSFSQQVAGSATRKCAPSTLVAMPT